VIVPGELTLNAYTQILSGGVVTRSVLVSVGVTAVGTLLSTTVSVLAAYGLSRPRSFGHRPILFIFLITMFFGAGLIPTYLLVSSLGLIDSYWALILPGSVSAFNVLILRSFFMGIDPAVLDAARIDGAGDWRILGKIVLPMSRAAIAVIALFYGVGYWNAFFNAILYINDNAKWPLQLVLRSYVLQGVNLPGSGTGVGRRGARGRERAAAPDGGHDPRGRADPDGVPVRAAALHEGRHLRRSQGLSGGPCALWGPGSGPWRAPLRAVVRC
jgi:putative aldouronate transport system permease protein